jgi:hypothetical protein
MLIASAAPASYAQTANPRVFSPDDQEPEAPPIDIWLDQSRYDAGATIRPHFQTEPGAYVTIVRVTTDGQLRVMYPSRPGRQAPQPYRAANDNLVPYSGVTAFGISESSGTGFIFAIASYRKFDFESFSFGDSWNNARLANSGRYGNPFDIVRRFIDETLDERADFSMDYATYEVFSRNNRSRYSTRYAYASFDDYYDRCYSAFGYGYSNYCQNYGYYNGYYGVIVGAPRVPRRAATTEPKLRPLVPDPMLPHQRLPDEPVIAQSRDGLNDRQEAALYSRRERMRREGLPRVETGTSGRVQGPNDESRAMERRRMEPRNEPRGERLPFMRSEPRSEPVRAEPRVQPQAPARVEVRNEPRVERIQRAEPRQAPAPVQRDGDKQ